MTARLLSSVAACAFSWLVLPAVAQDAPKAQDGSGTNAVAAAAPAGAKVVIETSLGTIKLELWPDKAPGTVSNFLAYVDDKFYDGLTFHRVIKGFMIQGGAFAPDMRQKLPKFPPIRNEGKSSVKNARGTISMARADPLDSATCQFFINQVDNQLLDKLVYCVFGKVTEGMDVVDAIASVPTVELNAAVKDVPREPVLIKSIRRDEAVAPAK